MASSVCHTIPNQYEYEGIIMSKNISYKETLEVLQEGGGPDYEILVATPPRAGTARLMEIIWLIQNDCDIKQAKEVLVIQRHTFLDVCCPSFKVSLLATATNAKIAKSHLPYRILSKQAERNVKVVVGLRNPKDALVSYYHFYRMSASMGNLKSTFDDFFELFKAKHLAFGDIFDFSIGWWEQRYNKNVYICFYEDVTANPSKEITKIAEFLGKKLNEEQLETIVQWTSFQNMSAQESTNYEFAKGLNFEISRYMRSGTVGEWKKTLTEEQSQYIDRRYNEMCLPRGLHFTFE